jgi:Ca2+-binding RTX toxin-like protein
MTSAVANASNTTPIVITTAVNHGLPLNNGNLMVRLSGVGGNTAANGDFAVVTVLATDPPNQFTLAGSAGNGAYTGGGTWFRWNSLNPSKKPGGQGGIHASLAVDPTDSNGVYVGGDRQDFPNFIGATDFSGNLFRGDAAVAATSAIPSPQWEHLTHSNAIAAIPGGGTATSSAPHADSRDMVFDAGGDLIEVDDGGVFRRSIPRNNTGDWISLNGNLQVTELHDIAYDPVSSVLIGGAQDTGNPQQSTSNALSWNSFALGDGGDVQVDSVSSPGNSIRYTSAFNFGGARRTTFNAANVQQGAPVNLGLSPTAGSPNPQFQFVTPLELNQAAPTRLVIGAANAVYESSDQGDTITSLAAGGSATAMAYGHPTNADVLYVGTGAGVLVRTTAVGALAPTAAPFPGGGVQDLTLAPASANTAYVVGTSRVYQTTDAGSSWTDITGDLTQLPTGVLRSIIYVPGAANDKIYVGADRGLFVTSTASFGFWNEVGQALPNALVFDLAYGSAIDTLFIGTLGRSAWSLATASAIDLPPVALCRNVVVEANATCQGDVVAADVDNGSFDPDGQPLTSRSLIPPGPYALGFTPVVLQIVSSGGTETCQATVNVIDTTPPVFTFVPPALTITSCLLPDIGQALASDSCSVVVTNDAPTTFPLGTTIVTWTATDSSGNSVSATQAVTAVLDDDPSCCPAGTNIILGTSGHDTLFGTEGSDCILGRGGKDVVHGRGGDDFLAGGQGDDQLHGNDGNDYLSGGAGNDHLKGDAGDDQLLDLSGNDNLQGDQGNDMLSGGPGNDMCIGGPGDDLIDGGDGDDLLIGGPGNDALNGNNGFDRCKNGTTLLMCE